MNDILSSNMFHKRIILNYLEKRNMFITIVREITKLLEQNYKIPKKCEAYLLIALLSLSILLMNNAIRVRILQLS